MQTSPMTVTEIHDALSKRLGLDISRKTVERDMIQMIESVMVSINPGPPSRYTLNRPHEFEVTLGIGDIKMILQLLEPNTDLYLKLKRVLCGLT
jgi:hypothetical protein